MKSRSVACIKEDTIHTKKGGGVPQTLFTQRRGRGEGGSTGTSQKGEGGGGGSTEPHAYYVHK